MDQDRMPKRAPAPSEATRVAPEREPARSETRRAGDEADLVARERLNPPSLDPVVPEEVPLSPAEALASVPGMAEYVSKMVEDALAKRERDRQVVRAVSPVPVDPYKPEKYLVKFRNDVNPKKIYSLIAVDEDGNRLPNDRERDRQFNGRDMQFQNGVFYATTPEQVRALTWAMNNPTHEPLDPTRVRGGDPNLYIDPEDAPDIFYCPGCGKPHSTDEAMQRHYQASHVARSA